MTLSSGWSRVALLSAAATAAVGLAACEPKAPAVPDPATVAAAPAASTTPIAPRGETAEEAHARGRQDGMEMERDAHARGMAAEARAHRDGMAMAPDKDNAMPAMPPPKDPGMKPMDHM